MGWYLKKIEIHFKNGQVELFEPHRREIFFNEDRTSFSFECSKDGFKSDAPNKIEVQLINVNYIKYIY